MTLKMLGLNEESRAVFANREFIQPQAFAISQSVAEAREETMMSRADYCVSATVTVWTHPNYIRWIIRARHRTSVPIAIR